MAYANVTAAKNDGSKDGKIVSLAMADNVAIYKESLVCIDASGYANFTPVASKPFAGVAIETVDNTLAGHTAGGKSVRVATTGVHYFSFPAGGASVALIGSEVYWDDSADSTPVEVSASDQGVGAKVGRIVEIVSATKVGVLIDGYAMNVDGQAN